jgi:hypothetical protein
VPRVISAPPRGATIPLSPTPAPVPPPDPPTTEYSAYFVAHAPEPPQPQIRHPDHRDLFNFGAGSTGESTYNADHTLATTVHNPAYVPVRDFQYCPPKTENRRTSLERYGDVNPLSMKHRLSDAFEGQSSYQSNFLNFFPSVPTAHAVASPTFAEAFPPAPAREPAPEIFPLDIEARDPATDLPMNSEYRTRFIDFANPPENRREPPRPPGERPPRLREFWDGLSK